MLIKLNPEQEMLRSAVRAVGQKCGASPGTGAVGELDPSLAGTALAPLGLDEILDAPLGGPWSGCVEAAVTALELGRALVPHAYVSRTLASVVLAACAAPSPGATLAVDPTLRTLTVEGDASSAMAWDAAECTSAVALRRRPEGGADVLVAPLGVDQLGVAALDLTRRAGCTPLDGAAAVGSLPADFTLRLKALALTLVAADIVGTMDGSLDIARTYALGRKQFGQPIGSFQAVQHLLAEQHIALQAARIATYHAAWCAQEGTAEEAMQAARVAKAYASEVGITSAEAVIQVHGGIGFTWEHAAHLFLRRAAYDRVVLGDERMHYRTYLASLRRTQAS